MIPLPTTLGNNAEGATVNETNPTLKDLDNLERVICKGLIAYDARNDLIKALVASGHKQADIARRINIVRKKLGAPQITPDAVAATIKRVDKKNTPQ